MWAQKAAQKQSMYAHTKERGSKLRRRPGDAAPDALCQRCLQKGHYIYECKAETKYVARQSRSSQLKHKSLRRAFLTELPPDEAPSSFLSRTERKKDDKKKRKGGKKKRRRKDDRYVNTCERVDGGGFFAFVTCCGRACGRCVRAGSQELASGV